ncbi:histidine phosphatase family protein [Bacillus sp. FJAT-49732]|uniref:Histidine phosphatase family protein n=1 Tax=Lederbergia citrisecunda TaxID=2833583 RepID=A0A942TRD0_9BACI|nr:histidine phosphatase family protein [Lederbergia citrisecunda]MBS4202138.1 histidine phosphatase family protein [Lederbergia citrisecunda]
MDKIFLLRHGMRLDLEDEAYWRHYAKRVDDTPLSANGINQAQETAELLKDEGIKHIFASPFFRTLQTANIIAEKLDLKVNIEYGFMEQLAEIWFSDFPEIITKEEAFEIFPSINKDYKSFVMPKFPENVSKVDVFERVGKTLEHVFEHYHEPILIVGHGASVWETTRNLWEKGRATEYPPKEYNQKMCALHKFTLQDGKWELALSTTEHLSYVDTW